MNLKENLINFSNRIFKRKNGVLMILIFLAFSMWLGIIFFGSSAYVDEKIHDRQINRFFKGNYDLLSNLTTIPGYHVVIASISKILNNHSSQQSRFISLFFSLLSIWVFYLVAKKINSKNSTKRTLQYTFLPISFLYFPLIYTDIFSLLIVFTAFYFSLSRKYKSSALFSLFSILVRQNNIVWVVFIWIYSYIQEYGFSFSVEKIKNYTSRTFGHILVFIMFLLFVFLNKGVAIGEQDQHHMGFYSGNLYFFLALVGVLFFPILFSNLKKANLPRIYWGLGLGMLISILLFFFTPDVHRYNLNMKFLRNIILQFAYNKYIFAYAFSIILGCVALFLMKLKNQALLIIPFIAVCLSQSFLVEQRYSIIPIVFLLLFRQEQKNEAESILIVYFFLFSSSLLFMLLQLKNIFLAL